MSNLRYKNKRQIVCHAFRVYGNSLVYDIQIEHWTKYLERGGDLKLMLSIIKQSGIYSFNKKNSFLVRKTEIYCNISEIYEKT